MTLNPNSILLPVALFSAVAAMAACDGKDATVGDSQSAVTCGGGPDGEVFGTFTNPNGDSLQIDVTDVYSFQGGLEYALEGPDASLYLSFPCGVPVQGTTLQSVGYYDFDAADCPLVARATFGFTSWDMTADAVVGAISIDDDNGCLAGTFDLDANNSDGHEHGSASGWFRLPEPQ